jgi:hypothetical protein
VSASAIPSALAIADTPLTENMMASAATLTGAPLEFADVRDAHHRALEVAIQQRIQSRLPGRVRNLVVRSFESLVILEGQCATYYTKQLAQHAAMGVLEDEHLENAIAVTIE